MTLAVDGLACERGGRVLFRDVAFAVPAGGALIVTGPNGVGKSSLLRVIAGLLRGAGTIERPDRVALASETTALDGERTLRAGLTFWATIDALPDTGARVDAAMADCALTELADVPVRLFSTGQRRRATLARVIASQADLWLLDEPANGLDTASVTRLEHLIARHREGGGAVVVATHQPLDLPCAQTLAIGAAA